MKKHLFFLPIFGLFLSGCTLDDLMFWKKKDEENSSQKQDDDKKDDDTPEVEDTVPVKSVTLNKDTLTLEELQSEKLTCEILPTNATNKAVEWSTSDGTVASVIDGTVYANNPGTATITVASVDGNKKDTCAVTVTAKPVEVDTVTKTLNFHTYCADVLHYTADQYDISAPAVVDNNVSITFAQNDGGTPPRYNKGYNTKKYEARAYAKNSFEFVSTDGDITEISFTFSTDNPGVNALSPSVGTYENDKWTGKAKSVTFDVGGTSGHRRISEVTVKYEGTEPDPEETINLGVKTIQEVKEYIAAHPVEKNDFGNGVNEHRVVTIKGFALAKIDLVKTLSAYGLDVTERGRVIMADATGSIGVATKTGNEGTCLWGKVGDHVCKDTSKYVVTGYLSEVLGNPEILVTSFQFDSSLDISWSASTISESSTDLAGFYNKAKNMNYNCAGHGYGQVVTINNLKCYYHESDGSGVRYYNFTDGNKNIRVNAYNLSSVSDGSVYDVTGIISMKNLSPIIVAFEIKAVTSAPEIEFDYMTGAREVTIAQLKAIHGSQEDTSERFDDVVTAFGDVFKTTGYMCVVEENGKYYVGISDTYYSGVKTGKDSAMANNNISLFKNDHFWNVTADEFHDSFTQFIGQEQEITVYYVVRQQRFSSNKTIWESLLIPDFINSVMVYSA